MKTRTKIEIVSWPEYDEPIAEVWCDDALALLLVNADGKHDLLFYPRADGQPWRIGLDELNALLITAKKRLAGV